jgi:hypothetical protein
MKIFAALLLFSQLAHASTLEWAFDASLAADMLTTADIRNHPDQHEMNPVLGRYPSDARIAVYGATAAGLHYLVTRALEGANAPPGLVTAWELLSIGVEVGWVAHNYSLGLRVRL